MMIKGAGHFVLDERVNLTQAVLDAHFSDAFKRQKDKVYDPILDWELPDEEVFQRTLDGQVSLARRLHVYGSLSPVWYHPSLYNYFMYCLIEMKSHEDKI